MVSYSCLSQPTSSMAARTVVVRRGVVGPTSAQGHMDEASRVVVLPGAVSRRDAIRNASVLGATLASSTLSWSAGAVEIAVEDVDNRITILEAQMRQLLREERNLDSQLQDARASRAVAVAQRAGLTPIVPTVLELDPDNWEAAIGQPRRTFVEFYAPWCPYCKRLEPIWSQLATDLSANKSNVQIARLNADTFVDFMPRYDVQGFPTLVLFENGRPVSTYQGRAELEPLTKFVN